MENTRPRPILHGLLLMGLTALLLTGCDYWPPALQAEIERLQNEVKQAATERATLEEQLNTTTKLRDDAQTKVEELTRSNQELAAKVAHLDHVLIAERQKMAKMIEAARKAPAKTGTKVATKVAAKSTSKTSSKKKTAKAAKGSGHASDKR